LSQETTYRWDQFYEDKGVKYFIKDPEEFRDKRVVIAVETRFRLEYLPADIALK
jgi:hypothetical protein